MQQTSTDILPENVIELSELPVIANLTEEGLNLPVSKKKIEKQRTAARALVFNSENKVALFCPDKKFGDRIPGGGLELGETIQETASREVMEELGIRIKLNPNPIAKLIELKNEKKLKQTNFIFRAEFVEFIEFDKKIKWLSIDDAIEELYFQLPKTYKNVFRRMRDIKTLEYVK